MRPKIGTGFGGCTCGYRYVDIAVDKEMDMWYDDIGSTDVCIAIMLTKVWHHLQASLVDLSPPPLVSKLTLPPNPKP